MDSVIVQESSAIPLVPTLTIELFDSGVGVIWRSVELDETVQALPDLSRSSFDSNCGACGSELSFNSPQVGDLSA